MSSDCRVIATISPSVETKLMLNKGEEEVATFFKRAIRLFSLFKNSAILVIPIELKQFFYTNIKLRHLKNLITENPQSNIMFLSRKKLCNTVSPELIFKQNPVSVYTKTWILDLLYMNRLPVVVGLIKGSLIKQACPDCPSHCNSEFELLENKLPDHESSFQIAEDILNESIDLLCQKNENLNDADLKLITILMCLIYGIEEKYVATIKNISFLPSFVNDIRNLDKEDIVNICFSAFRASVFPSATGIKGRHKFSIDWHRNDPFRHGEFTLFRVDIISPTRTGVKSSGRNRVLMAKRGDEIHFLYYTCEHDFVKNTLQKRVDEIDQG